MEMHLESTRDQSVDIPAAELSVQFAAFETIHTESRERRLLDTWTYLDRLSRGGYRYRG